MTNGELRAPACPTAKTPGKKWVGEGEALVPELVSMSF